MNIETKKRMMKMRKEEEFGVYTCKILERRKVLRRNLEHLTLPYQAKSTDIGDNIEEKCYDFKDTLERRSAS